MREIQEATNREAEGKTGVEGVNALPSTIANDINAAYVEAESRREATVASAASACNAALRCGALLSKVRVATKKGGFGLWLEFNCPNISQSTAWRYTHIADKYSALNNSSLDFKTLKELYVACGIMPAQEGHEPSKSKPMPVWERWTMRFDNFRDKLKPDERQSLRAWLELQLSRL